MDINLSTRLSHIWESPDFFSFFKKYSKRPVIKIKKGQTIFYEGDQPEKIYFVQEGFVKLYHLSEDGKDTITYLYGPGSILGLRALTEEKHELKHNAEALTNVSIQCIKRLEYVDILKEHPEFLVDLLHVAIERLNYTEQKLVGFITTDVTARVSAFLHSCALRFCTNKKPPIIIPLPLTHQQIADFVGSLRETVTGTIQYLEKEQIIEIKNKTITILNLKKLEQLALRGKKSSKR